MVVDTTWENQRKNDTDRYELERSIQASRRGGRMKSTGSKPIAENGLPVCVLPMKAPVPDEPNVRPRPDGPFKRHFHAARTMSPSGAVRTIALVCRRRTSGRARRRPTATPRPDGVSRKCHAQQAGRGHVGRSRPIAPPPMLGTRRPSAAAALACRRSANMTPGARRNSRFTRRLVPRQRDDQPV